MFMTLADGVLMRMAVASQCVAFASQPAIALDSKSFCCHYTDDTVLFTCIHSMQRRERKKNG